MNSQVSVVDQTTSQLMTFPRERLKAFALLLATLFLIGVCLLLAWPFLPAITWAVALAVVGEPLRRAVERRVRWPGIAAAITVLILALTLAIPIALVSYKLISLAGTSTQSLQAASAETIEKPIQAIANSDSRARMVIDWLREGVDIEREMLSAVSWISRSTPSFLSGTTWVLMQTLIMFMVLFYFIRDHDSIRQSVSRMLPLSMEETQQMFGRVDDTIHATIYGSLLVALIQGTLGGLMFWWLGLPMPLLWGVVMSLLAVVPNLGTFVVWAPASLLLGLQGEWGKAALLVGWGLTAIGLIDNLLYPVLVGNRLRMHPLLVFFSVLGGLSLFGVSGIILGPVALAVLLAVLEIWRVRTSAAATPEA